MHREGDIRAQAARLLGHAIAQFNAGYRKERPAGMPDIAEERVMEIREATSGNDHPAGSQADAAAETAHPLSPEKCAGIGG